MNNSFTFSSGVAIRQDDQITVEILGEGGLENATTVDFKVNLTFNHGTRSTFALCTIKTTDILKLTKAEMLEKVEKEHLIQQATIKAFRAWQSGKESSLSGIMSCGDFDYLREHK